VTQDHELTTQNGAFPHPTNDYGHASLLVTVIAGLRAVYLFSHDDGLLGGAGQLHPLVAVTHLWYNRLEMANILPILGITMGDAAGVGPEIVARTLAQEELYQWCRPLVIGAVDENLTLRGYTYATRKNYVLSREEVIRLFKAVDNLKHRAILLLIYAAGLRVSEAARLKVADVDGERRRVFVRGGKGVKDRYTIIGEAALEALRDYWRGYQPRDWLFPGAEPGRHLSPRSIIEPPF
jgi:hypothetical protein